MPETISEFIDRAGITATVALANSNPNMADSDHMTRHFLVTLRHQPLTAAAPRLMVIPFSGGDLAFASRPSGQPNALDVMECLRSDASSAEEPFGDWCATYGEDEDSRRAYATWEAVRRQTAELREFLGESLLAELLDAEED